MICLANFKSKFDLKTESTILSTLDYGDILYADADATTLKPLDAVYHSALI